jgi:hypothetical protein
MRSARDAAPAAALAIAWVVGCQGAEPSASPAARADGLCESGVSYESFAGPFLLSWCTGCHASSLAEGQRQGAPPGIDFDSESGVRSHIERIAARVADHTMPPAGGPSDEERALLLEWVDCGMPGDEEYFAPAPPEQLSRPPPDTRACAAVRAPLPPSLLPRCAPSTRACRIACADGVRDDDAVRECRDACTQEDPTPPAQVGLYPVDCEGCQLQQLVACAETIGCRSQVADLMCCIEDCIAKADPACFESECRSKIDAFGQCVYYQGEHCLSDDNPEYIAACYGG